MASPWSKKPGRKPRVPSLATAPGACKQLTPEAVRAERLALAHDMLTLVLGEGDALPSVVHATLRSLHQALLQVWTELERQPLSRARGGISPPLSS